MKTIHTPECIENDRKLKEIHDAWIAKWPNYCKACKGWGGAWSKYDPSPSGVSLSSGTMDDFDPCMICSDEFICARCGFRNDHWADGHEDEPCKDCGWDPKNPDAMPPDGREWPCSCELEEERRQQEEDYKEMQEHYEEMVRLGKMP